jgi:hypothetical protein
MHPHHLHALAALHSLQAAWPHLTDAAVRARQAAAEGGDLGTLRSQTYGTIGRTSGHGDPIGTAVERSTARVTELDRYSDLELDVRCDFDVLAAHVLDDQAATLTALLAAVPDLPPVLASMVADGVDQMDRRVRKLLRIGDDLQHIAGHRCPHCDGAGALAIRTSAPVGQRPVICTLGCRCTGPGCCCGMGVQAAGVAHIWTVQEMTAALARQEQGVAA